MADFEIWERNKNGTNHFCPHRHLILVWATPSRDNRGRRQNRYSFQSLPAYFPDCFVPMLSLPKLHISSWWTEGTDVKVVLRSITEDGRGQFVMTSGTWKMPRSCAGSWDVARPLQLWEVPTLGRARVTSCWTTWVAEEMRCPCCAAITLDGGSTTVPTMKMLLLSAQVLPHFFPPNPVFSLCWPCRTSMGSCFSYYGLCKNCTCSSVQSN